MHRDIGRTHPQPRGYTQVDLIDDVLVVVRRRRYAVAELSKAERLEAAVRMDRAGISRNVIADRTRLNSRTLWDHLESTPASAHDGTIAS